MVRVTDLGGMVRGIVVFRKEVIKAYSSNDYPAKSEGYNKNFKTGDSFDSVVMQLRQVELGRTQRTTSVASQQPHLTQTGE